LEEEKKVEKQEIPVYVTAIFIALSGIGLLLFTVYYIAFLPVPVAMQPLRIRILTALQLEEILEEEDTVLVTVIETDEDRDRTSVYSEPDEDSPLHFSAAPGDFYEKLEEGDGWIKIGKIGTEEETETGWIKSEMVEVLDS